MPRFSCSNSSSYWRQTKELWRTNTLFRFTCVSVQVKLAEPERRRRFAQDGGLAVLVVAQDDFWWKISG